MDAPCGDALTNHFGRSKKVRERQPKATDRMRIAVSLLDSRLRGWGFPHWGSEHAAGLDLHACLDAPLVLEPQAPPALISAGIVVRIRDPEWCGLIFPRSGLGHREGLVLGNGTGVIDADYEGSVLISAWNRNPVTRAGEGQARITIEPGDRIAQLVFTRVTRPELELTDESSGDILSTPARAGRGHGGFGSTGR